jgi:hypothetical protein
MTPAIQPLPIALSREVLEFAAEQGVADYLAAVLEMTNRVCSDGLKQVVLEADPEIAGDRHIVVVVKVNNLDVPQGLEMRSRWHSGLFESCPPPLVCVFRLELSICP